MAETRGGSARLLSLLKPYKPLFAATIGATVISSVLDGFTFVLLIPFLRTLFGKAALPAGDANCNGIRDIADALIVLRRAVGVVTPNSCVGTRR